MKIVKILFLLIAGILIIGGCSGPASSVCPDMGTITGIDSPESPIKTDMLIGSNAPDFTWSVVDFDSLQVKSQSASLSQYQGKPIMIIFHKSMNCPGCKQQMPYIQACYGTWKDKGLNILTIYRGDEPKDVKNYVQSNELDFCALADPEDMVAAKLGFAIGAPMSVFIDKSGIIQNYQIGAFSCQADIENILSTLE